MIWPPLKAWTSKKNIEGQRHFVAIKYGGERLERWIILMAVLDSTVVIKVVFPQLADPSNWECGWDENNYSDSSDLSSSKVKTITFNGSYPSVDSGLTMPITKNFIRPWFGNA